MFGYVKVYKDELKVKEYDIFRAYYCGLCKTLKHEYGFSSRLGLNYDSVFLALLLSSVTSTEVCLHAEHCIVSPIQKKPIIDENPCLSYSAAVMVILALLKLKDDMHDDHSIKAMLAYFAMLRAKKRVLSRYNTLYKKCKECTENLSKLETAQCTSVDAVAHEFATLMQIVFIPDFVKDENTKRILGHIGYMLGRFIYILDAYEDIAQDKKKKRYNVFLKQSTPPDPTKIHDLLTLTLSSIANSYELLDIKINKPIIDNILYLGLSNVLDQVTKEKETKK